jgi:uncharacterized membrane protein YciS (DUF1049 family)
MDEKQIALLDNFKVDNSTFHALTPLDVAKMFKSELAVDEKNSYFDLVFSAFILQTKKRIRFATKDMNSIYLFTQLEKLCKGLVAILTCGLITMTIICVTLLVNLKLQINDGKQSIKRNKMILMGKTKDIFGMDVAEAEKIMDIGIVRELLLTNYINPIQAFQIFKNVVTNEFYVSNLSWNISSTFPEPAKLEVVYGGALMNPGANNRTLDGNYKKLETKLKISYNEKLTNFTQISVSAGSDISYNTYPSTIIITEKGTDIMDTKNDSSKQQKDIVAKGDNKRGK